MATKIRLLRRGRKKYTRFDLVVADSRSPRDGKFIEKLGLINPNADTIELNEERALYWVLTGATPTDSARTYLSENGIMFKKHLQIGVNKGAITQEQADKKFQDWKDKKLKSGDAQAASETQKKADERKAKLAAETKVNEARKAAQAAKAKPAEVEAPAEEAAAEGAEGSAE